eukprot:c14576_g1_i1.p2 GENE.c14576_g1_i1~~c14576_g1_i1.p2  ORF type:complete len:106 (-),score=19.79 c14576_g1_i1:41-358(-)
MVNVLEQVHKNQPHSLFAVNILTNPEWFARYRYDIPVLYLNGQFLAMHRLSLETVETALQRLKSKDGGEFQTGAIPPRRFSGFAVTEETERERLSELKRLGSLAT